MKKTVFILIPVYNDFESLEILIRKLETVLSARNDFIFSLFIVDDASVEIIPIPKSRIFSINLLRLNYNTGHQKAIAIGLAYIHGNCEYDYVLVLDGDGEDKPEDTNILINESLKNNDKIVFASRTSRQEGMKFRFFYALYKLLFTVLTGKQISFGNFVLIPRSKLSNLVYHHEIWNHLSAAIVKSGFGYIKIPLARGSRYSGTSKMNFLSLVIHGFTAISVFLEQVAARLLIFSFILITTATIILATVIIIKYFTALAIPGWASTIFLSMLIILLQGFLLSLVTVLLFLSSRSQRKFIPALHYKDFIASIETIKND